MSSLDVLPDDQVIALLERIFDMSLTVAGGIVRSNPRAKDPYGDLLDDALAKCEKREL